jgi:hypothetical protein
MAYTKCNDSVIRNIKYYTIGHFSKFVPVGYTVIQNNNNGNLNSVGFMTPTGFSVLAVFDERTAKSIFNLRFGGRCRNIALPAGYQEFILCNFYYTNNHNEKNILRRTFNVFCCSICTRKSFCETNKQ